MDSAHLKLRSKFQRPFFSFNNDNNFLKQEAPRTPPIITMNEDEVPRTEVDALAPHAWSTPTTQSQPTPSAAPDGLSYGVYPDNASQPSMDSSSISLHQMSVGTPSRPISAHQELQTPISLDDNYYGQKPFEDQFAFHGLPDLPIGQAYTSDEAIPIFDLDSNEAVHSGCHGHHHHMNFDDDAHSRRISGSSFTMSTSGALSDIPSYEDFSTALSDAPSFSDYPPPSNRNSWMSSTQLSPVASPRMSAQGRSELVRTQSRGRASPSPRPSVRSAPYSIDGPRNNKRWSTGSYGPTSNRRQSPFMYHAGPEAQAVHARMSPHDPHTDLTNKAMLSFGCHPASSQPPYMMACPPTMQRNSMLLPTQLPSQLPSQPLHSDARPFDAPAPLLSHGLFRMLQSNADAHSLHRRYAELSDPPDLFGPLSEEQSAPPEEDMNPSDPDMVPREQDLRFEGDLYTPRWVRGHGNKREGWCGICKPGRWLVLKNSAYWYDKSFSHGISAATGSAFQEPLDTRRMDGNPDVWEGLCGGCNEWIALVSSKKKGTTWFRHAYKCHSHPKAKDSVKRRRESGHNKNYNTGATSKPTKAEPATPQQYAPSSAVNTPMSTGTMPGSQPQQQPQALFSNDPYSNMI